MKLLLPLKFYDASGRVIPSAAFYLCLLFLGRSVFIFVVSILAGENSDTLLRLFYPEILYLYINLGIGLPALLALIIVGFREKIWLNNKVWFFKIVKPLIIISIFGDLTFHLMLANLNHWKFSWVIAITTLIGFLCLYFIVKDNHIRLMLADWRKG